MRIVTEKKVCDRCGSENFENEYGDFKYSHSGKTWQGDWGGISSEKMDLCGACIRSLMLWLNEGKQK